MQEMHVLVSVGHAVLLNIEFQQFVTVIVADNELGSNLVVSGSPQSWNGIHTATVAAEAYDGPVGMSQLDANRAWEADAQRTAACRKVVASYGWRQVACQIG